MLEGGAGKMAIIPLNSHDYKLIPGKHASQFVNATNDFFWIDYIDTELEAKDEKTIIATLIVPVSNKEEARKIADSKKMSKDGAENISVSFTRGVEEFVYVFDSSKEGLTLKK
jgi:hypothetical protein